MTAPDIAELHERVGRFLTDAFGSAPTDDAGDFLVSLGDAAVWVRAEAWTGDRTLVRVWAITNVGVRLDDGLGRFLLHLNGELPLGGLRLDAARPAVVFSDCLLGDYLNRPELSVTVAAAAATATQVAPRIKERFGGLLFTEL